MNSHFLGANEVFSRCHYQPTKLESRTVTRILSKPTICLGAALPTALVRPTRRLGGPCHRLPSWTCSGQRLVVASGWHPTLAEWHSKVRHRPIPLRLCASNPRLPAGGCYPLPCPVESGVSSGDGLGDSNPAPRRGPPTSRPAMPAVGRPTHIKLVPGERFELSLPRF